jgi:hypothetical protein
LRQGVGAKEMAAWRRRKGNGGMASAQRKWRHGVGAKEIVIPAKAGIHFDLVDGNLDSRLRGNDDSGGRLHAIREA